MKITHHPCWGLMVKDLMPIITTVIIPTRSVDATAIPTITITAKTKDEEAEEGMVIGTTSTPKNSYMNVIHPTRVLVEYFKFIYLSSFD